MSEYTRELLGEIDDLRKDNDQLQAELVEDKTKITDLRIALALANSMILCGEKHSDKSRKIIRKALKVNN